MSAELRKRGFDLVFSAAGLLVLSPLMFGIALVTKLSDRGPVFFRQLRIGRGGRPFFIVKFRSMVVNAAALGPSITSGGDPRITAWGRFLRRTKLDELPQLWNVLRGDMSFVGPRPEVPRYVERYSQAQRAVLELRPGITDLASIVFRNEEEMLRQAADPEAFYVSHCIPRKIELNLAYARRAGAWQDLKIILQTVFPPLARSVPKSWGIDRGDGASPPVADTNSIRAEL